MGTHCNRTKKVGVGTMGLLDVAISGLQDSTGRTFLRLGSPHGNVSHIHGGDRRRVVRPSSDMGRNSVEEFPPIYEEFGDRHLAGTTKRKRRIICWQDAVNALLRHSSRGRR